MSPFVSHGHTKDCALAGSLGLDRRVFCGVHCTKPPLKLIETHAKRERVRKHAEFTRSSAKMEDLQEKLTAYTQQLEQVNITL